MNQKIVISLGSNLGDRAWHLKRALNYISTYFELVKFTRVIETDPLEYLMQPNFLNQLAVVQNSQYSPYQILALLNSIERSLGRERLIDKGPRTIDLDIIAIDSLKFRDDYLVLEHPAIYSRDYLKILLKELNPI